MLYKTVQDKASGPRGGNGGLQILFSTWEIGQSYYTARGGIFLEKPSQFRDAYEGGGKM